MADEILRIKSINQLHQINGFDAPKHPLISIIDVSLWEIGEDFVNQKFTSELYTIALKDSSCGLDYGRNHYDFDEGVMMFTAPNQVASVNKAQALNEVQGWMLCFHPDLIRTTPLGENIESYTFFSYDVYEALHLSKKEEEILNHCLANIKAEYSERIDSHSQRVIVSSLELLLNYCSRFYERQFHTREAKNKDIVTQVEEILKGYYKSGQLEEYGSPSLHYLADKVHLSPTYLSDLLKKETGRSAKDHINDFLIDKAKTLLLSSADSVSEIAYTLGFNYPHYFSRLFKNKTGITPQKFREERAN